MTGESGRKPLSPEKTAALKILFDDLPEAFDERHAALKQLRSAFHERLAQVIEPALNQGATERHGETHPQRRRLSAWIDKVTRELGITVYDPRTGSPALLVAESRLRPKPKNWYSLLSAGDGVIHRVKQSYELPHLDLKKAPTNIESLFESVRRECFKGKGGLGRE